MSHIDDEVAFAIATNGYQLCEGWAFGIRQPNTCTKAE
jgi:hypothetical protein